MNAFNTQMLKLSAIGVTVLVSSGDQGAIGYYNGVCSCYYGPSFPATNPYVTAVGATQGANSLVPTVGSGEIACQVGLLDYAHMYML